MTVLQCIHDITTSYGLIFSLFLGGLVGGFTHCTVMCSPFVLAQTGNTLSFKRPGSFLLLPYHLGRMTTYVTLAVIVNSLINFAFIFSDLKVLISVPFLILAGTLFFVSAFPRLLILFPWASHIRVGLPYRFITRFSSSLVKNPSIPKRYALGVLLGFMPCGLVVSALFASITAPNTLQAALAMSAFTIGTMPALILVAFGGQALKHKYPQASVHLSQGALVISGLWLFVLAGVIIL